MGVIIKQSIKSTIYGYIGAGIGFVNVGLLMPKFLTTAEIGLTQYIFAITLILAQFTSLGFNNVTNRLFPYFRNKSENHYGFFTLGLMVSATGSLLSILLYFSLKPWIITGDVDQILIQDYIYYVIPLTIVIIFLNYFDNFLRVLFNASFGMFLKEILARVLTTLSIVLYIFKWVDFSGFIFLFFFSFSAPVFAMGLYLLVKGEFALRLPRLYLLKQLKKPIINISAVGLLTGFGNVAILQIDKYMLNTYLDLSAVGIYTITFFFAAMVLLPSKSINRIATIVLSESWKNKDYNNILTIYTKSTITQFILGFYILLGLWVNIDNIIAVIGAEYEQGRYVILIIGITNLLIMLSGVNQAIIATSKKYYYSFVFVFIMLFIIILTNWIFIPKYGILGAAIASLISVVFNFIVRYWFSLRSFKLQPYNYKHFIVLAIGLATYYICIQTPSVSNPYFDVILKGIAITIVFIPMVYFSKVSEDINQKADELLKLIFKK